MKATIISLFLIMSLAIHANITREEATRLACSCANQNNSTCNTSIPVESFDYTVDDDQISALDDCSLIDLSCYSKEDKYWKDIPGFTSEINGWFCTSYNQFATEWIQVTIDADGAKATKENISKLEFARFSSFCFGY